MGRNVNMVHALPPVVTKANLRESRLGYWHLDMYIAGRRVKRSTKQKNISEARVIAQMIAAREFEGSFSGPLPVEEGWDDYVTQLPRSIDSWLHRLWSSRKQEISYDDLETIALRSGGRCEVSGIRFEINTDPVQRRSPFAPSLDRIAAGGPYSAENCRLVALCINLLLHNWGDGVWTKIVDHVQAEPVSRGTELVHKSP